MQLPLTAYSSALGSFLLFKSATGMSLGNEDDAVPALGGDAFCTPSGPLANHKKGFDARCNVLQVGRNIIHGSDAVESAKREIGLWFSEGLADYTPALKPWIYE